MMQLLVAGLSLGAIYALVALGFIMIYRASGALNFGQGDFVTVGAFAALLATRDWGWPIIAAWLFAFVVLAALGAGTYFGIYRPLRGRSFLVVAIATLGLAIALRGALFLWFGPNEASLPSPVGRGTLNLAGVVLGQHALLIIGVTGALVAVQATVFRRTFIGKSLRATSEDPEMARLLGLPADRLVLTTFMYGSALSALAGVLLAPTLFVSLNLGFGTMIKALVGAIIGGFGSIPGALIGGLVVGLAEVLGAGYVSTEFRDTFAFGLLIVILLVRPSGIIAVRREQKV